MERSDSEVVDAVPVFAEDRGPSELVRRAPTPIVRSAAVAAGSFVAGAAVFGLVRRRQARHAALVARPPRRVVRAGGRVGQVGEIVEVVASRSLLVDVHLLGRPASSARGR